MYGVLAVALCACSVPTPDSNASWPAYKSIKPSSYHSLFASVGSLHTISGTLPLQRELLRLLATLFSER